jgi:hypothetical protein
MRIKITKNKKVEPNRTWLIQRLGKPYGRPDEDLTKLINAFSFGGGLVNGGLSDEAMQLLGGIFSFDYMGSAEFEWGAVPKALEYIAKQRKKFISGEATINKEPVYYLCYKDIKDYVENLLADLSKDKLQLKELSLFNVAVGKCKYIKKEDCKTFGWLELDNGFFFFTDQEMYEKTKELFEIK